MTEPNAQQNPDPDQNVSDESGLGSGAGTDQSIDDFEQGGSEGSASDLPGSGISDSLTDGGPGVSHDSRLGSGGAVGADIGGQGGSGASGNANPDAGPARGPNERK